MTGNNIPVLTPFNPLDKRHLAESITNAMLRQHVHPLPPEPFIAAGIYAIYYTGNFPLYQRITELNVVGAFRQPIYVGKAVPEGARKGGFGLGGDPGCVLQKRLCEHAKSIDEALNLEKRDFSCRFLAVDDIWIPLAESLLIEKFSPLWNRVLDGFGNHDPGSGRANQQRSQWDTLHPGRQWAEKLQPNIISSSELERLILEFINIHYK
jgi:hypothetical protein